MYARSKPVGDILEREISDGHCPQTAFVLWQNTTAMWQSVTTAVHQLSAKSSPPSAPARLSALTPARSRTARGHGSVGDRAQSGAKGEDEQLAQLRPWAPPLTAHLAVISTAPVLARASATVDYHLWPVSARAGHVMGHETSAALVGISQLGLLRGWIRTLSVSAAHRFRRISPPSSPPSFSSPPYPSPWGPWPSELA